MENSEAKVKRTRSSKEPERVKRTRRTKLQMQEARGIQPSPSKICLDFLSSLSDSVIPTKLFEKTTNGWVNIYYNNSPSGKHWYSTGGDIHDSVESARTHAQKGVLSQVQITYPLKRED